MKDESFELLTKLYSEFSTFRQDTTEKLTTINKRITTIDNRTIRMENEHGQKIEAALDGYKQVYEKLLEHDKRFDVIEEKLDLHGDQIVALKKNA